MAADLHQEREIFWGDRDLRQGLDRHKTCQLCDVDLVRAKCHRWLSREGVAWHEVKHARPPGLTRQSRLTDGEYIIRTKHSSPIIDKANAGIGDRAYPPTIDDGKEHGPE